ncbi:MAG: CoB--CoM heterodisulfide reductase iron-sulfur subunit B family protein [Proteobacteria bacterium]|nr:CoB--CoM heterodisulfide reductase iron-sulfur subunit B family protein [Pseudomonadota bacterium]
MATLTYYPGCSLKTSSKFYEASIKEVFSFYGIGLKELGDWSCCGASAAHTVDEMLAHALAARNIAMAEADGNHFFAPCSACYNRSRITNEKMLKDKELREEVNKLISPLQCLGTIEIKNIIEVFHDYVGIERIARGIQHNLSAIKVVPYYGCVLTRIPGVKAFDDVEDPVSMDTLLWAVGTELVKWPFKMECCGASKTLTNKDTTLRLSSKIMDMARAVGADMIVTSCPLCQMNLDLLPYLGTAEDNLPVLFLSEVFELALFGKLSGSGSHIIPVDGVVKKVKRANT